MTENPESGLAGLLEDLADSIELSPMVANSIPQLLIYDPIDDPIQAQLKAIDEYGASTTPPELDDLATPAGVRQLLSGQRIAILERQKAQDTIEELEQKYDSLSADHSDLRVEVATISGKTEATWLEIPMSFLLGLATNMLTDNNITNNATAIAVLVMTSAALIYIRRDLFRRSRK